MIVKNLLKISFILVIVFSTVGFVEWVLSEPQERQRDFYLDAATYYFKEKKYDDAIAENRKAISYDPKGGYAYYFLGIVYQEVAKTDSAIAMYEQSVIFDPSKPWPYYRMSQCYALKHDSVAAQRALLAAVERSDKDYYLPYIDYGRKLFVQKDYHQSIIYLDRALLFEPKNFDLQYLKGLSLKELKDYHEARKAFEKCRLINSVRFEPDFHLGVLAYYEGKCGDAVPMFQHSITLKPDFAYSHYHLGKCLASLKRIDEAIQSYQNAVHLQPTLREAWIDLIQLYRDNANYSEALKTATSALVRFPIDNELKQQEQSIQTLVKK